MKSGVIIYFHFFAEVVEDVFVPVHIFDFGLVQLDLGFKIVLLSSCYSTFLCL